MKVVASLAAVLAALSLTACGGDGAEPGASEEATLVLDFQPNAVHAGIYAALVGNFYLDRGVRLHVREPSTSSDAPKLLESGRADFAILDIHDLAIARGRGFDIVAITPIVQRPLAAVIAADDAVHSPDELEGREVGVTGLPSDEAVLDSVVAAGGGDPDAVDRITIGFEAVPQLSAGRLAAATAIWNAEGVALRAKRPGIREFRVDDFGAPPYPELVLTVSRETLQDQSRVVRAAVSAIARGYSEVLSDPENGISALLDATTGLARDGVAPELRAVSPAFTAGARTFGELDRGRLEAWARWERRFGIVQREPDVGRAFDGRYVPASGKRD